MSISAPTYSRTEFLQKLGTRLLATNLPLSFACIDDSNETPLEKLPRSPLNAPTEGEEPKFYPAAQAPKSRTGYAVVGLGHLALDNILPAFSKCKYSKVVAVVSGDHHKASVVASQYGIESKNIYDYTNFDSIAGNKEIEAVYIVLPNGLHHEFTIRAAKAGKRRLENFFVSYNKARAITFSVIAHAGVTKATNVIKKAIALLRK